MTQENKSEGSEGSNPLSGMRDHADGEDMAPFKKRVRFLSSDDLMEVTNDKTESSDANRDDVTVSSTPDLTEAGEENKKEIIPTQKTSACTTNEEIFSASLSQRAISESGDTGNEDGAEKHEEESEKLIEHTAAVGGGSCSQTGTTVSGTTNGQDIEVRRLEEIQQAIMNDGSNGSSAPRREEQRKGQIFYRRRRVKQSSSQDKKPVQDKLTPEGKSDNSGDALQHAVIQENQIQITEGDTKRRVDTCSEDERHEEVQNAATEVGEMSHDDGGERGKDKMIPEGEDDCSGDAPDVSGDDEHIPKVGETKQEESGVARSPTDPPIECEADHIDQALEVAVKDGHDGSSAPISGEDASKVENKLLEDQDESEMIHDDDAFGKEETNTIIEDNNGGNGEGDSEQQGIHSAMENVGVGNNNNSSAPEGEKPMEGGEKPLDNVVSTLIIHDGGHGCSDNILGVGKQAQEPEPVTKHGDGSSRSYADTKAGSGEGDGHEQVQLAAMEDGGNENISNSEAGVEEQSNDKGKEPVEADHHEQEQQQTAIEDDGNENVADVVVSGEEVQDKKGKKPMEYAPSGNDPESGSDVGNKGQLDHQGTNPDANDDTGPSTFVVSSEGDHNNQIQQAAIFEDPDTEIVNINAEANSTGYMAIQGDMQTQQDPMTTIDVRKRTRSIHEQGEASHDVGGDDTPGQEARKKCKFGGDEGSTTALCLNGVGYNEPQLQQANRSFLLSGAPIPGEQEPDVARNTNDGLEGGSDNAAGGEFGNGSPPTQQPTNGIQLFGVYITEGQVQPVARRGIQLFGAYMITGQPSVGMQNGDRGNSDGGGESSMQRPKSGVRLFGFNI
ncbi:unnamed protein product [Lactuca saligna]|uniref:Uncharacterized protein n=1 Tax=Lactuca saligna TaxID=75948 RepID=A0AA36DX73_LACSI|nr:unnamed protein product [Lactuca saligna]